MTTRRWLFLACVLAAALLVVVCGVLATYRWLAAREAGSTGSQARIYPTLPSPTLVIALSSTPTTALDSTGVPSPTQPPDETPTPIVLPTPSSPAPTALPPDTPKSPPPSDTPPLPPTATTTPSPTPDEPAPPAPTSTRAAATEIPPRAQPPLPPQQGGEWDMEAGFIPGVSPLGEDCPGWAVAVGWQAFLAPGTPASSCLNENKNPANVKSGQRSQEITFDFISAEAGIYRRAKTIPGHRYQIEAWGKHVRSDSPVELSLGVDLTGGEDWQAPSVTWQPWDETEEESWVRTQVIVRAEGGMLTLFLKGFHPYAAQGGATLFDDVRVTDLGP